MRLLLKLVPFALVSLLACASQPQPSPVVDVPAAQPAADRPSSSVSANAEPRPRAAADYAIGPWHLGLPVGALAQRTDLWGQRRWDVGGGDMAAMTLGQRHPTPDDPLHGSHIVLTGPKPADGSETSFVPTTIVVLGRHAGDLMGLPALLDAKAARDAKPLGPAAFTVAVPLLQDAAADGANPQKAEVICRATRVCTVSADDRFLGYLLGDAPSDASARLYKGLRRLVLTHLGLR
jgi:hypothetical protein